MRGSDCRGHCRSWVSAYFRSFFPIAELIADFNSAVDIAAYSGGKHQAQCNGMILPIPRYPFDHPACEYFANVNPVRILHLSDSQIFLSAEHEGTMLSATVGVSNARFALQEGAFRPETQIPSAEIFIVDDDPMVSDLLKTVFSSEGYRVTSFNEGVSFCAVARQRSPNCIILDVCLPGRSGLEILTDLDAHNYSAPIIIMSGMASISMAVEAIRNGAFDIIEKPFAIEGIVSRVRAATDAWARRRTRTKSSEFQSMGFPSCPRLTQREEEVLAEIVAAASNREAGCHLGISPRTIEVHRARIMKKLGAKNTADLVRIALAKRHLSKLDCVPSILQRGFDARLTFSVFGASAVGWRQSNYAN